MNGLQVGKVVVLEVQTEAEIKAGISPVDDLEIPKLHEVGKCISLQHKDKPVIRVQKRVGELPPPALELLGHLS